MDVENLEDQHLRSIGKEIGTTITKEIDDMQFPTSVKDESATLVDPLQDEGYQIEEKPLSHVNHVAKSRTSVGDTNLQIFVKTLDR
jgi:hypothetical protein